MPAKRCFHDGFPIEEGKPTFTFPVTVTNKEATLSKLIFCSLPCVKAHLVFNTIIHPNRLEAFTMYVARKYGITHVTPAPDKSVLACYRTDGGISIEKFREHNLETTFGIEGKTVSQVVVNETPEVVSETQEEDEVKELILVSKQLDNQYKIDIGSDRGNQPVVIVGNDVKTQENITRESTCTDTDAIPMDTEIAGADTLKMMKTD